MEAEAEAEADSILRARLQETVAPPARMNSLPGYLPLVAGQRTAPPVRLELLRMNSALAAVAVAETEKSALQVLPAMPAGQVGQAAAVVAAAGQPAALVRELTLQVPGQPAELPDSL